jgi:hypothetical protein
MSSSMTIFSSMLARLCTQARSVDVPRSGVGLMLSGATLYTSDTASTTMPAVFSPMSVCTRTTMTTLELSAGRVGSPKRVRRSMTGTMTPRRFMTPSR